MSEWISVKNGLPKMEPAYTNGPGRWRGIVTDGKYVQQGMLEETYKQRKAVWKGSWGRNIKVTHWRPLPNPPEEGE